MRPDVQRHVGIDCVFVRFQRDFLHGAPYFKTKGDVTDAVLRLESHQRGFDRS
ncbi:MAG: hypothetical protein ACI91Z_001082 [Yoonia sp.]|jgi:hypothetical protein